MRLRPYAQTDAPALAAIYRNAVLALGTPAYTPQQVAVWASFAEEADAFAHFLAEGYTVIAEIDDRPVSFCQLKPLDHVALLYTDPEFARQGMATAVYHAIEQHARAKRQSVLTTDASKISRPFFEQNGFTLRRTEQTHRHGVYFERYQMEKNLLPTNAQTPP